MITVRIITKMDSQEKIKQKKNPRETANIFSIRLFWYLNIFFCKEMNTFPHRWMNSLMGSGYKKQLELEDLFEPRKKDESDYLGSKLEK